MIINQRLLYTSSKSIILRTIISKRIEIKICRRYYPGGKEPQYFKRLLDHLFKSAKLSNNNYASGVSSSLISKKMYTNSKIENNYDIKDILKGSSATINEKDKINPTFPSGLDAPMPESIVSAIKYFPLKYKHKEQLSGLKGLTDKQFNLLTDKSDTGAQFRCFLNEIHRQISFNIKNLFENDQNVASFEKTIINIFGFSENIKTSQELYSAINDAEFSIKQHLLTMYANNHDFGYELLNNICKDKIDCSSYQGFSIRITTIIEAILIKEFMKKIPSTVKSEIFMPNPDNLGQLSVYYNPSDAMKQTNQKNTDCILNVYANKSKIFLFSRLYYYDIKTYSISGKLFNLAAPYVPKISRVKQMINDLFLIIKNKKENNKNSDILLIFDEIVALKNKAKGQIALDDCKKIYNEMLTLVLQNSLGGCLEGTNISVPFDVKQDIDFDNFRKIVFFPEIDSIEQLGEKHQKLFPKDLTLPSDTSKNIEDLINMLYGITSDSYKESIAKFREITYDTFKQ